MGGDTWLHSGHVSEQSKPPTSDPRLDILKTCAVLHFYIRYAIEPADPENAPQAAHVESLQPIDIGLEQGPRLSAVQEN
jgi:hypothetical protein